MLGWFSEASNCASRLKRAMRSAFRANTSGRTFQRHVAVQLRVPRAIDFSHAARAERRENFVWSEPGSGTERHCAATLYVKALEIEPSLLSSANGI